VDGIKSGMIGFNKAELFLYPIPSKTFTLSIANDGGQQFVETSTNGLVWWFETWCLRL